MNQPLLEAKKYAKILKKRELLDDIIELEESVTVHMHRANSMKAKEEAKKTIDKMIKEEDGM